MRRIIAAAVVCLPAAFAGTAQAAPSLDLPFPCGTSMSFKAWKTHSPSNLAIDINGADGHDENGDPVVAPADGTVVTSFFSHDSGYGNHIQIKHGAKTFTLFAHLQDRTVQKGAKVRRGQLIGHIGNTSGTGRLPPHLHYEQRSGPTSGSVVKAVFRGKVAPVYGSYGTPFKLKSRNCAASPSPAPVTPPDPVSDPTPPTPPAPAGPGVALPGVALPGITARRTATIRTDNGLPVIARTGPRSSAAEVRRYSSGATVRIVCQSRGEKITGKFGTSTLWNLVDLGGGRGAFVTDTYVYTGSDGRVAPNCP